MKKFRIVVTSVFHFHVETIVGNEIFCSSDFNIYKREIIRVIKDYQDRGFALCESF